MDDQRRLPDEEIQQDTDQPAERPRTMFDEDDGAVEHDEMIRFARKRAAIWGLAAGGIMSLLIVICAVLLYLAGTS